MHRTEIKITKRKNERENDALQRWARKHRVDPSQIRVIKPRHSKTLWRFIVQAPD